MSRNLANFIVAFLENLRRQKGHSEINRPLTLIKFIYSEKAPLSTLDLSCVVTVKFTMEILENFVAFSEVRIYELYKFEIKYIIQLTWLHDVLD